MPNLVEKTGSRPPWVGLAAAAWVQIAAGTSSTFPLYSAALKSVLGFNQQQITILGVACDLGENLGLLPGYVSNKLPPWAMLLIGSTSCFLGYSVLWSSVNQIIHGLPFWLVTNNHTLLFIFSFESYAITPVLRFWENVTSNSTFFVSQVYIFF